ncbi:hypothetical protein P308_02045 [Pseudomonas piscis]|nr:hypothetical protein P308_02045 [Pseudomonas piscis]
MQWMFMLLGAVLGWIVDESLGDALIGAFLGLAVGLAFRLGLLHKQVAGQQLELQQARQDLSRLGQRLELLEAGNGSPAEPVAQPEASNAPAPEVQVASAPVPEPAAPPQFVLDEILPVQPATTTADLVWELPPAATPAAVSEPLPDSAWRSQPQRQAEPQPAPSPAAPVEYEPNLIERAISGARNWLFGGNTVLRVGVVLLFLGLAFLLRYATEGVVVPIELRYAGVAACSLGLLGLAGGCADVTVPMR